VKVRETLVFLSASLEMLYLGHFSLVSSLWRLVRERERILGGACQLSDTEVSNSEHEVSLVFVSRNMPLWRREGRAIEITSAGGTLTLATSI